MNADFIAAHSSLELEVKGEKGNDTATVNLGDSYEIPMDRPYTLFREVDRKADYRTRSMLATPLRDAHERVFGVLQLINAVDAQGQAGSFSSEHQAHVQTLAALAAQMPAAPTRATS